ncbi:MAG: ATP-binding cassette domain-containing protein, partial [Providencia sp.]
GAGKSSLLNLLLGFLPYKGSITVNGIELNQLCPDKWRALLGWVGQNPHLPEQTLIENICLGKPDATESEVQQAIDKAYVSEFIPMLPDGLNTRLGDYAARLSVGQAQRVAVARVLLKPSHLLLLDEPAASLDAHSEQRVMQTLNQLSAHQTTILVTHLLEETVNYDQIWVMANGQIIQRGDYKQLSQSEGVFAQLLAHRSEEL